MRLKVAYKLVVLNDDRKYHSTNAQTNGDSLRKEMNLTYEIGKITVPIMGKIFCFPTEEAAQSWRSKFSTRYNLFVMKGIVTDFKKASFPRVLSLECFNYRNYFETFWETDGKEANGYCWKTPNDTHVCSSFKPLSVES